MEQLETDLSLQPRLSKLNRIQEAEADQLGMSLAHRAGWPVFDMVSFYRKLASVDPPGFIDWTHPSATSRFSMATALAWIIHEGLGMMASRVPSQLRLDRRCQ